MGEPAQAQGRLDSGVGGAEAARGGTARGQALLFLGSWDSAGKRPLQLLQPGLTREKKGDTMGTGEGIWTDPLYLSTAITEAEPGRFGCSRMEEGTGELVAFNAGPSPPLARPQKTAAD